MNALHSVLITDKATSHSSVATLAERFDAVFSYMSEPDKDPVTYPASPEVFDEFRKHHPVDKVVLHLDKTSVTNEWIAHLEEMRVPFDAVVEMPKLRTDKGEFAVLPDGSVRFEADDPAREIRESRGKRALDIACAMIGLFFMAILLVVLGPAIAWQSKASPFYVQDRIGVNGRRFKMYKFRSMYADADARRAEVVEQGDGEMMFKMADDPRVIGVGRFMRRHSLDEFPQFINVLLGDMSAVGTRPPIAEEWNDYEYPQMARMSIKPGVTGLWQISGRSEIRDFKKVVALDLAYIDGWTLARDVKIILRTIAIIFTGRGAS